MMKSRKSWRYTSIGTRVLTQGCDYMTGCLHQHALSNRTPETEKTKCKCENGAHYRCVWQFYRWKWKLWALLNTLKLNRVPDNRALYRYFIRYLQIICLDYSWFFWRHNSSFKSKDFRFSMKMYEEILVRLSLHLVTDHRKSGIRDRIEHVNNPSHNLLRRKIASLPCECVYVCGSI